VLGLIGLGNIPRRLAPKAKAFGIEVIAYGDNHYWYHSDPQITVVAG